MVLTFNELFLSYLFFSCIKVGAAKIRCWLPNDNYLRSFWPGDLLVGIFHLTFHAHIVNNLLTNLFMFLNVAIFEA